VIGASIGVIGASIVFTYLPKSQNEQEKPKAPASPIYVPEDTDVSLAGFSDDKQQQLSVLEFHNQQLRRELILMKSAAAPEDADDFLSNADVERMKMMFRGFDTDCSGTIPVTALPQICAKLGDPLNEKEITEAQKNITSKKRTNQFC